MEAWQARSCSCANVRRLNQERYENSPESSRIASERRRPRNASEGIAAGYQLKKNKRAKFGYLRSILGKAKNAKRTISLTARASEMLRLRMAGNESSWIFPGEGKTEGAAFLSTSLDGQHSRVRTALGLPKDFVLHSLRHTFLPRLGEAGVDSFTIMRIAG